VRALFLSGQHIIHPPGVTREARYRRAEFADLRRSWRVRASSALC